MPHAALRVKGPSVGSPWVIGVIGALALVGATAAGCASAELPPPAPPVAEPPSPVTTGDPTGSADTKEVAERVRATLGRLKTCFEKGLRRNPHLAGKVVIHWSIALDGSPFDVSFESTTLPDEMTNQCVARQIAFAEFSRPGGGIVDVSFPFVFQAAQ